MNLLDLMQIWALKNNSQNPMEMLTTTAEFDSRIDVDVLALDIVQTCGAMTPVFNRTDVFVIMHKQFFNKWSEQISKLLDTLELDYSPLENYSRLEERITNNKRNREDINKINKNILEKNNDVLSKVDTRTENENYGETINDSTENKVSAYNESLYQPENKSDTNTDTETTRNSNVNINSTDTRNVNRNIENSNNEERNRAEENNEEEVIKTHGMNGNYSYQKLLEDERKVAEFNIYQWITNKYMEVMMLCVF